MKTMDIVDLIKEKGYKGKVYPHEFPTPSSKPCTVITVGSSSRRRGKVFDVPLTVISRAKHPKHSEDSNDEIRILLDMLTDVKVGNSKAISIIADSPMPVYSGKDENNFYYHSSNLTVLIDY